MVFLILSPFRELFLNITKLRTIFYLQHYNTSVRNILLITMAVGKAVVGKIFFFFEGKGGLNPKPLLATALAVENPEQNLKEI